MASEILPTARAGSVYRQPGPPLPDRPEGPVPALTLTLGEPAHSSCRVESARRRGSHRERNQHRGVRTTVAPFAEGTSPVRRTRGAGARARRSGERLPLLRHGPARPGTLGRDDAPLAVAARDGQGAARV